MAGDDMHHDDGGPAFPRPLSRLTSEEVSGDQEGMSLRDYFAAHAPSEYASWFTPKMPPRPAVIYDHDHPNEPRCNREWVCPAVNAEQLSVYDEDRREQYERQWPYAYADAMLVERAKAETASDPHPGVGGSS